GTADEGRAKQVAVRVGDQAGIGMTSVRTTAEAVDDLFGVARASIHKLERAGDDGRAKQVALGVGDQAGIGRSSVRTTAEAAEDLFGVARACLHKLEHGARVLRATSIGRAEQVAVSVSNQAGNGISSVRTTAEAIEDLFGVARASIHKLEYGAVAVGAAIDGGAEKVAVSVRDQVGSKIGHGSVRTAPEAVEDLFGCRHFPSLKPRRIPLNATQPIE